METVQSAEGLLPLVSIITACLNNASGLAQAIQSIRNQSYPFSRIQFIIIDGGSADGTPAVVESNQDIVAYFISEKDKGIADAWNKGLAQARGELIGLLNSDDTYAPDTIAQAVRAHVEHPSSLLYGECRMVNAKGIVRIIPGHFNPSKLWLGFGFVHTTCFVPRTVYERIGGFDLTTKIAVDADFLIRAARGMVPFVRSSHYVYMATGGLSDRYAKRAYLEFVALLERHGVMSSRHAQFVRLLYAIYFPLRVVRKSPILRIYARKAKHLLVAIANKCYQWTPTFQAKRALAAAFGIKIGKSSYILRGTKVYRSGNLLLGDNVIINRDCLLDNRGMIEIGHNVSISHSCKIYTAGHDFNSPYNDLTLRGVKIADHVIIFANVQIQPGVSIAEGAVVLPGTIVTKDVEKYSVVAGIPGKAIGRRNCQVSYKNDYPFWYAL